MPPYEPPTTLIGDLVASKRYPDRAGLQRSLAVALDRVNGQLEPEQPLELTVGDEFQGCFRDVAAAARASLLIRLELLAHDDEAVDSRYGLGLGEVTVFDRTRSPAPQDGPGWWAARAAIDRAKILSEAPRTSFVRTCFSVWTDGLEEPRSQGAALEAFLFCRDATVDQMNARQRRLLRGLMLHQPQARLAADEGITQGAVSQSLRRSGAFALEAAQRRLEDPAS